MKFYSFPVILNLNYHTYILNYHTNIHTYIQTYIHTCIHTYDINLMCSDNQTKFMNLQELLHDIATKGVRHPFVIVPHPCISSFGSKFVLDYFYCH